MSRKFVYSKDGKVFIIGPNGYHQDCGLPTQQVKAAGHFRLSDDPTKIDLFGESFGYNIGLERLTEEECKEVANKIAEMLGL